MRLQDSFLEKQNNYSSATDNFTMIVNRRYIIEIEGFSEPDNENLPERMFVFSLTRAREDGLVFAHESNDPEGVVSMWIDNNDPETEVLETIAFSSFENALAYASGIALKYHYHF